MPVRFAVTVPGLESDWVEVSEVWTRREVKAVLEADEQALVGFLQTKLTGCHLTRPGADPLEEPGQIDADSLDELDLRLVDFLGTVLVQATAHLRSLGPLAGRLLSPGSDNSTKGTTSQTTETTDPA